ncbi:beta-N-acetylhexosaminidase [Streptomyces sp. ME19-01-6]|uniref:beta-N-acetylhexosaminidase n=1 Tax=Streptomyces sp. ME19-01-6 TaxID=3028686 RepID=UPI0029BB1E49|nr:beta-N-acetylhexosaminidase [Streptomyces sp. ME19-01-6]MDX3232793.1 beta-N-acetylhexosaminidase [Streptomyces sp. ME19-01-6]
MNPADLIPAPRVARELQSGARYPVDAETLLHAGPGTEATARWLRATVGAATGLPLGPGEEILLQIAPETERKLGPEGYRLTIDGYGVIRIEGGGPAGVFWGAQTFRQLLGPDAFRRAPIASREEWTVPCVLIEDAPRFAWRGLMLDVARHFMPKGDVLDYVDLMAAHKLNVLHLHLTDDQGWRLEIRRYPRLTEVGAWRERTKFGHRDSPLWDERPHGGYYTQDDIREIVAYAAERHITVVPEIDVPGHSQAAIAAYPELGNADAVDTASLGVWTTWGVNPNVLSPADTTLRFYENVLEEVLELFPGTFVHLGGDECPKEQWRASPAAQDRIRELGLADEDELQNWFLGHFGRWLAERGRRLIGWDEILEGSAVSGLGADLPEGAAVSSWRGYAGGIAAARAGHDVVMCPKQHVYFDYRQAAGDDEPVPIGYVRTLEDVYRFEPVPPELTGAEAERVLGAQANVWTEVLEDRRRVDYQTFPRLAAFAEAVWSPLPPPSERDFAGFRERMTAHYARLDALGVDYRPPGGPRPWQRRPAPEGMVGGLGRPIDGSPPIV